RAVEVDGPAVVAQARPRPHDVADVGGGAAGGRREPGDELAVAGDDAPDLGLLQHELADEDHPWVPCQPPRQVAPVAGPPVEDRLYHVVIYDQMSPSYGRRRGGANSRF